MSSPVAIDSRQHELPDRVGAAFVSVAATIAVGCAASLTVPGASAQDLGVRAIVGGMGVLAATLFQGGSAVVAVFGAFGVASFLVGVPAVATQAGAELLALAAVQQARRHGPVPIALGATPAAIVVVVAGHHVDWLAGAAVASSLGALVLQMGSRTDPPPPRDGGEAWMAGAAIASIDAGLAAACTQASAEVTAGLFAIASATGALTASLIDVAFARLVHERLGPSRAALVGPLGTLVAVIASVFGGPLGAVAARAMPIGLDPVGAHSAGVVSANMASPGPDRSWMAGAGAGAVGVVIALVGPSAWLSVLATSGWAVVAVLVAGVRAHTLGDDLRGRNVTQARLLPDAADDRALVEALRSTDAGRAHHALVLIASLADAVPWKEEVRGATAHAAPAVRLRALRLLAEWPSARPEDVEAMVRDPDDEVRAVAIETWAHVAGPASVAALKAWLGDPVPAVGAAAIVGLVDAGGAEGARLAADHVQRLATSADPALRQAACRVVRGIYRTTDTASIRKQRRPTPAFPGLRELLLALLDDPQVSVRNAALLAAGASADPVVLPRIVVALGDARTATTAANALAQFGSGVEADLAHTLDDNRRPVRVRVQVARLLGRMGTSLAGEVLAARCSVTHDHVRGAVFGGLARLGARGVTLDHRRLTEALRAEIPVAKVAIARWRDLRQVASGRIAGDTIRQRANAAVERVFALIRARHPELDRRLERSFLTWKDGDAATRARVVELVRAEIPGEFRDAVMTLLDPKRVGDLPSRSVHEHVDAMISAGDDWLVVCGLDLVASVPLPICGPPVHDLLMDELPEMIRDAATRALYAISDEEGATHEVKAGTMLTTVEKVIWLKGVALFAHVPAEDLVGVAEIARPVAFRQGDKPFVVDDDGDALFLVVWGKVRIVAADDRELAVLGSGEVFGEMAILDPGPRSATVEAVEDVHALRIGRDEFQDLVDERPEVLKGIVSVLVGRLRNVARG